MDWLKETRIACAMTGEEVGAAADITQQHYNFIENGKRRPSVEVAKRIAEVLGFEWTRFYEDGERIATPSCGTVRNDGRAGAGGKESA